MTQRDDTVGLFWDGPPPAQTIFHKIAGYRAQGMSSYAAIERVAVEGEASEGDPDEHLLAMAIFGRVVLYAETNGVTRAEAVTVMLRAMAAQCEPAGAA